MSESPSTASDTPPDPSPPRDYLVWGLLATALCFLPMGIVALVYGFRVGRAVGEGRDEDARRDSRRARRWLIATVVVGLVIYLVIAVVFALLGAFSR